MEVDLSECTQEKELVRQQSSSLQLEHKKCFLNESVLYLEKIINDPTSAIVRQQITGNKAKMLVILTTGEQRLITFDLPIEDCTVHDLLVQVNISLSGSTVSLVDDPECGINYVVDLRSRSVKTSSDNDHTDFTSKSTQEIVNSSTNNDILFQNTNALDENSNTCFRNTETNLYLKNFSQKNNHVGQKIVRQTCSNTNTLHVRPAAKVPPEISKPSVRVQDPKMNCLYEQNSSQRQQQLSNTLHPVQSSLKLLPSRRPITPNSVQQKMQRISISPQTQQIQKQPMITSPALSAERNKHDITNTNMEVDLSECTQEKELVTQQSSSLQLEHEENSSESVVYIQKTIINDPTSAVVQQQVNGNKAKMLVTVSSGVKSKLITFDILNEYCTVHDLLVEVRANVMINQANISISESTVSLLDEPALGINYILDVNSRSYETLRQ